MSVKAWMAVATACALVGAALLAAPLHWICPDDLLRLDAGTAVPETGHAFLLPLQVPRENDRDGLSELHLYEDGRPLGPPHAAHDTVRTAGGGAFSHWGDALYFSSSDASDPRTNGRVYEARWPQHPTARAALAAQALLVAACVISLAAALRGARGASRGVRRLAWALALVLVAGTAPLGHALMRARLVRERLVELAASFTAPESSADTSGPSTAPPGASSAMPTGPAATLPTAGAARSATPRTLRLLDAPDALEFTAKGEPAAQHAAVAVTFPASLTLAPGEEAACSEPLDLREEDLAELHLLLRVRQGKRLLLRFTMREQDLADGAKKPAGEFHAALEVPVVPSDEWQALRLQEPLVLAGQQDWAGRDVHFTGLTLVNPAEAGVPLEMDLRDVELSDAGALYARTTHGSGRLAAGKDPRLAWWQSCAGEAAVPLPVEAAGRRLSGSVALLDPTGRGGEASYRVDVEDVRGARRTVLVGTLDASQGWTELQADLPASAPSARLVIGADDLPPGSVLAWSALRCVDPARRPQRAILVLVDTLRADATGCCGGAAPGASPALDALASQGASFTRCYSQASWTRPSMPSLFTGRYVAATGVQFLGERLPARYETIAESFASAGFHTLSFLTNTNAGPAAGLDQGFDEARLEMDHAFRDDSSLFLERIVSPRLAQLAEDDLFVFVHLMEVHEPFGPALRPADWREPSGAPVAADVHLDRPWVVAPTDASRRRLYALDVSSTDRALGAFLECWLQRWEDDDGLPVTVAVASDHGEFLGENGRWGHGWGPMLQPVLHVPLVLRAPGRIAPGTVCDDVVQNVDIGITLLQLAGVPDAGGLAEDDAGRAGRSLLPLLAAGRRDGPASALAGLESGSSRLFTVITPEEWLVGENGRLLPGDAAEVAAPPADRSSASFAGMLLAREPDFTRVWDAYLESQRAWRRRLWDGSGHEALAVDPGTLEQLRALGYLGR